MGNFLYYIAVFLVITWAIAFLGFHAGSGLIPLLLVIAIIAVLLRVISGRTPVCLHFGVYPQIYIINAFSISIKALPIIFTWKDF